MDPCWEELELEVVEFVCCPLCEGVPGPEVLVIVLEMGSEITTATASATNTIPIVIAAPRLLPI